LADQGLIIARYGGAQATWRLNDDLTMFANYTAIDQSTSLMLQPNVPGQLQQIVGFGIGYTPRKTHVFRH
jgi:long-subunit fatty acid transport protein